MNGQPLRCLFGHPEEPQLVWHLPGAPDLVRCPRCGLVFLHHVPRVDATAAYDEQYFENYARFSRDFQRVADGELERIERYARPPGRFLDVGAGLGFHVRAADNRGWGAQGVEVSPWAVSYARQVLGLPVSPMTPSAIPRPPASADVVLLNHVLEHVPDPSATLRQVHSILAPGGTCIVAVPNWNGILRRLTGRRWAALAPEHHLWHFTAKTLKRLLETSGFTVSVMISERGFPRPAIGFRPTSRMLFNEFLKSVYVFHWFGWGEALFAVARKRA